MYEILNTIFKTFLKAVILRSPIHSDVERSFFLIWEKKKKKETLKRTLQICNISKAVWVFCVGEVVNPCAITYVLGEVINPYAIADSLSIAQTGQTPKYNVKERNMFMQKLSI